MNGGLLAPAPPRAGRGRMLVTIGSLAVAAAAVGWLLGSRSQGRSFEQARALFERGTAEDLGAAAELLGAGRGPCVRPAVALVRAQLWAEFGEGADEARAAVLAASDERETCSDLRVAEGLVAFADAAVDEARAALTDARRFSSPQTLAHHHHRWLAGMLALGTGDEAALGQAVVEARALAGEAPRAVAYHRLLARLELRAGEVEAALTVLARVRAAARTHMGLAADEALTNAALGRELRGVADLADQLLARPLGPQDRGHALLARAVVHVHAGEAAAGLARVDTAWPLLPWWDRGARALAMDLSLEAGDSGRARAWTEQQAVPEPAAAIYRAWALLVDGDAMGALALLAELPQEHPRVAYLQGLALVEQRRFEEAEPWLARVEQLLPGRVEIEVARARVAVATGDKVTALRKLAGLAEEEVYAPRAYTGLGEALLAQAPERRDLRAAQKALTRAVEREPRAAEAMLLLAQVWQLRRGEAPEGTRNALHWYEQAAASNPKLPRYREALAAYLADLGQHPRAEAMLRVLVDEPGISWQTPLLLVDLVLARDSSAGRDAQLWIATANALGAEPAPLLRARALLDLSFGTAAGLRSAQARLEQRLVEAPDDVDSRILLVRVRMAQHDDEAAETLVRSGIYTVGVGGSGRLFLAWARLEQRQHKRKQAGLHARAAFHRMQAEGRPAVELLAAGELAITMFLRTEQIKLALGVSRELTAQLPDSAEVWRLEARAQLDAGESGKARRAAARAIELAPEEPLGHELRAQIALRSGDRKTATAALAEALALAKDEESRARVLEAQRRSGTGDTGGG